MLYQSLESTHEALEGRNDASEVCAERRLAGLDNLCELAEQIGHKGSDVGRVDTAAVAESAKNGLELRDNLTNVVGGSRLGDRVAAEHPLELTHQAHDGL